MARKERYLVGLDVGTSKVTAIVGEMTDDGGLDIIGIGARRVARHPPRRRRQPRGGGRVDQEGDRRGRADGRRRDRLGAPRPVGRRTSRGSTAAAWSPSPGKNREITREDVRRAIDAAKAVSLPSGREILHVLPQDFVVDEQDGIGAPVGMTGTRLEVNVHIVTGSASSTQNIVACVNRAGVAVVETVLEQLAASEAVLTAGREGTRRRAGGHRRRHDRLRDLRARQPLAHRRGRASAAITSPTTSPSGCGRRFPTRRRSSGECGCALSGDGRRRRDDGGGERRRAEAARDGAPHPVGDPAAARRGDLPPGVGRDPARRLREVAQLRDRADRRRRDARGHAGDRRTDLRPADPPRRSGRRRRPGGSRQQPGVRDGRRARPVRASQSRGRAGRGPVGAGAFGRVAGRLRTLFKEFF